MELLATGFPCSRALNAEEGERYAASTEPNPDAAAGGPALAGGLPSAAGCLNGPAPGLPPRRRGGLRYVWP